MKTKSPSFGLFPSPDDYPEGRLFCLDILRGLDMFYLAVVSAVLPSLFKALGLGPGWTQFFCSHPWEGFTLYDIIMPLFIYMCGAAVPFALGRRLTPEGRPAPGYWRHVFGRVALLWILGMLAQGSLTTLDPHQLGYFNNTLQTIALGYLAAAILYPLRSRAVKIAVPLAILVAYGLLIHFSGDYTKDGNLSQRVDLAFWRPLVPADSTFLSGIAKGGYSWILPTGMYVVMALSGAYATELLRTPSLGAWRKAAYLAAAGALALVAGLVLEAAGVKCVKHFFTVSFTLQAIGWSTLALAALYVLTDLWKLRRGTGLLLLFGQCALAAYLCEAVFRATCQAFAARLFTGFNGFFPPVWRPFWASVEYGLVVIAALVLWRRVRACHVHSER